MNKKTKVTATLTWNEVVDRVIGPHDLDDVGVNYAVSRWREDAEKARGDEAVGEVICPFSAPKVLDAAVEYFESDIRENLAIYRLKSARDDRLLKQMKLRASLGEAQGIFVDEENGEHIVPEKLAVHRVTISSNVKMLKQVVQTSMALADNDGVEQPSWPTGLGDGIQDFAVDLQEFLDESGDEGREMVTHVCKDADFAREIREDDHMPRCIKFLAQIAAKTNGTNRLPDKGRRIGFGGP